jgi:hypothetical protein
MGRKRKRLLRKKQGRKELKQLLFQIFFDEFSKATDAKIARGMVGIHYAQTVNL